MDLAASCKDKLSYFRIKELKDILTQLRLSKQGKKQDLVDRILAALTDDRASGMWTKKSSTGKDDVAKLVDETYRNMQVSGATELATRSQGISEGSNTIKLKEEIEEPYVPEKIRCPCGSTLRNDSMIKCEDAYCGVWQHIGCVIISEKPIDGATPTTPETFYCEVCRLSRADPFWLLVATPLHPVKLAITDVPADGTNPVQGVDKTFQLTRADKDLLSKPEYDIQAWCMLLNDKVPFRMQWPQYADLQVNGVAVRAINRPGSQLLGANGRDDGPIITPWTRDGINRISLSGCDMRVFCLGVRIVKRRTVQQILNMIPKESEGESFEDALARVKRCVGGGTATENADSDSDLEVVADFISVNLRCPMSGSRMKVAGRFKPCIHMGCFDLDVFVEMNQRSRKWQCPVCLKNYALENIIIDPYFNRIALKLRGCGEDVNDIEVKPDGSWRAKTEGDRRALGDLGLWHAPDGSLCAPTDVESKPKPDILRQVKQEGGSDGYPVLKLGMRRRNGLWEISSKPADGHTHSSGNKLNDFYQGQDIIPMSSSATVSGKDGEDASVNQDGGENLDYATGNGIELESISLNVDSAYGYGDRSTPALMGDNEIIVLSDSDEENELLISSGAAYQSQKTDGGAVSYSVAPHGIPDPYPEDPTLNPSGSSFPGLLNSNDEDLMHMFSLLPSSGQAGPGFQLFGSDGDVSDTLVDMQPTSINCPINGYTIGEETGTGSAGLVPESSIEHTHGNINDASVDNHLVYGGNDQSLQLFLPTRPTDGSIHGELRDQPAVSNGIQNEDWISLRLGDGSGGVSHVPPATDGFNSGHQLQSKEGGCDKMADAAAALLLGMNDNRTTKTSRERSDSPFQFPRQRRSVRPRLFLSIDSDSE